MNPVKEFFAKWKKKSEFTVGNYRALWIENDLVLIEQKNKGELINHIVIPAKASFNIENNNSDGFSTLVIQTGQFQYKLEDLHTDNRALLNHLSAIYIESCANSKDREDSRAFYKYISRFFKVAMCLALLLILSSLHQPQMEPPTDVTSQTHYEAFDRFQPGEVEPIRAEKSDAKPKLNLNQANAATINPVLSIQQRSSNLNQANEPRADALARGVSHQDYSVALNTKDNDIRPVVFVFSDPLCPHCRSIEPVLDRLSADYQIHIFPVSVIGQMKSQQLASRLLCLKPQDREPSWKDIFNGIRPDSAECASGVTALENNNNFFRGQQLIGTPAIIRADGAVFPSAVTDTTEQTLRSWLSRGE